MALKQNSTSPWTGAVLGAWLAAGSAWFVPVEVAARPAPGRGEVPTTQASENQGSPAGQELGGQEPVPELSVSLITVGAGDLVYEMFGHNAIRIQDPASGLDVSYNWGMFDFNQEGFFWRFLLGDWQYWMQGLSSESMIAFYAATGRGVVEQELDLTPAQRLALLYLVERNSLLENRFYRYQYFLDNCSTRVRDVLDSVLGGSLRERFTAVPGETFRFHTRRLTEGNPVIHVPLDFFMSGRGDRPISAWYEMFIPMMVRDFLGETDLVTSETVVAEAVRTPLEEPPGRFVWFALTGVLLAGLLAGSARLASRAPPASSDASRNGRGIAPRMAKPGFVLVAGIWSLVMGVSGLIMIVSHFTSHEFMHWNENFLQANPLSLVLAGALIPAVFAGKWKRLAERTALLAAGVSALGLVMQVFPGIDQVNGYYLMVAVPAHLTLAWGLREVVRGGAERAGPG